MAIDRSPGRRAYANGIKFASLIVAPRIASSRSGAGQPTLVNCMRLLLAVTVAAVAIAGCAGPKVPMPITPPADVRDAPVARRPLETPVVPPASILPPPPSAAAAPIAVPPNTLYVCVSEDAGQRKQTAIEFAAKVGALCKRHPEMGPCQYERDLCRRSGGRVFASNGLEITQQVEDEYDRKVLRVRFRAN